MPSRDYTPRHLREQILQSRSAMEGERKQVSVLFADIQGSMELFGIAETVTFDHDASRRLGWCRLAG